MVKTAPDNDNKRRVLEATDIVRLIGEHLKLVSKGREYACLCPFHNDRNPSMYVVPAKQIFHCFVCGAGGNAIDFVMRFHGMGFLEALQMLAGRAGVPLSSARRGDAAGAGSPGAATRDELIEANSAALRFFRGILSHPEHGAEARATVERRGISPEMAEAFGVGASPDRWDGLARFVQAKGLDPRPFVEAGLLKRRDGGDGLYDAMRRRLIFPIFDQIGRPVAFGGRRLHEEDEPKYLNSPESAAFDKGATLFGLKQALRSIQTRRTAVVTEGYTDVIACHQAGFTHCVATLGTALTPKHASALRRLCDTLILLFDGDEAGQRAADRALEVFFLEPIDVRIAVMQGGKDPDELLKRDGGPAAFEEVLRSAVDFLDYRFARLKERLEARGFGPGSTGLANALENEIDRLIELGLRRLSPIRQQAIVVKLARLGAVDAAVVAATIAQRSGAPRGTVRNPAEQAPDAPRGAPAGLSALEHALGCLLAEPGLAEIHPEEARQVLERAYSSPPLRPIAESFSALASSGEGGASLSRVLIELEDSADRRTATSLAAEVGRITDDDHARITEHWRSCLQRMDLQERSPAPGNGSSMEQWREAVENTRRLHERHGGNPLAMPRPRIGAG